MKKALTLLVLLITGLCFSQSINDYKYVIVPERFEFQKTNNEYNINTLAKTMLEKYGFTAFYANGDKPDELALNRCMALYTDVEKASGILHTGLIIVLKDCQGNVLYTSEKGKSKEKEYHAAYNEAFRDAARSFAFINYKYNGTDVTKTKAAKNTVDLTPSASVQTSPAANLEEITLFAQPIPNGYQLIDSTPKVVLRIYKTSKPDSFTAIAEGINGLVFKKDNDWYFEYYDNEQLISKKLDIKF
jgi:hypothetical protein